METLYVVDVPKKQYICMIDDIIRMTTIQIVIQFLFYINGPDGTAFFSVDFILLVLYIALGVCVYWLIIKKLIVFK